MFLLAGPLNMAALLKFSDGFPKSDICHHFVGQADGKGIYAKQLRVVAGTTLITHTHTYDHISILASGSVMLTVDGAAREVRGPRLIVIEKGKPHGVVAITDAVWFCIHPTDETDADNVDSAILKGT